MAIQTVSNGSAVQSHDTAALLARVQAAEARAEAAEAAAGASRPTVDAAIKDGVLIIRTPTFEPRLSKQGKTLLIASAYGQTTLKVDGKTVTISLNAYIKP